MNISSIIERIAKHDDEKAFKMLFDIYYDKLFETAKFYLNDRFAAQEVVSEVFIKIWNSRATLEKIDNIQAYLYVAIKRQSLNFIRNNKRRLFVTNDEKDTDLTVEISTPEGVLISKEFEDVLNITIQGLPSKCRLVYSMVKDDSLKYREVAEILNISVKTVEMHIGKALKRIKEALDSYQN